MRRPAKILAMLAVGLLAGCGRDYCIMGIGPCAAFRNMPVGGSGSTDPARLARRPILELRSTGSSTPLTATSIIRNTSLDLVANGGTAALGGTLNYEFYWALVSDSSTAAPVFNRAIALPPSDNAPLQYPYPTGSDRNRAFFRPTVRGTYFLKVTDGTFPANGADDGCPNCIREILVR